MDEYYWTDEYGEKFRVRIDDRGKPCIENFDDNCHKWLDANEEDYRYMIRAAGREIIGMAERIEQSDKAILDLQSRLIQLEIALEREAEDAWLT